MASILDRYGIKEVANLTFYSIDATTGRPRTPVLYIDTAKVSTVESTAENSYATGGQGNGRLLAWDFGKEITMSVEDAVFSPKSLSIMFGDGSTPESLIGSTRPTATAGMVYKTLVLNADKVREDLTLTAQESPGAGFVRLWKRINSMLGNTNKDTEGTLASIGAVDALVPNKIVWDSAEGHVTFTSAYSEIADATYALKLIEGTSSDSTPGGKIVVGTGTTDNYDDGKLYVSFYIDPANGFVIEVGPDTFPGTYYITADTYARSEADGSDQFFQIIIPKGKVTSENTLTLEADGDPTVFNMNVEILRATVDGINVMMQLVQYGFGSETGTESSGYLDQRLTSAPATD